MPFQNIFGDDEHTSAEGPYLRVLKTRKWLYLAAGTGLLIHDGYYDPAAAKAVLQGVIALPTELLRSALTFALFYSLVQYANLLGQLAGTYDIVLRDRFALRQGEELEGHQLRRDEARRALRQARSDFEAADDDVREARARLNVLEPKPASDLNQAGLFPYGQGADGSPFEGQTALPPEVVQLMDKRDLAQTSLSDAAIALRIADERLRPLINEKPASRGLYRVLEAQIDVWRVVPPLLFGAWVLWLLLAQRAALGHAGL